MTRSLPFPLTTLNHQTSQAGLPVPDAVIPLEDKSSLPSPSCPNRQRLKLSTTSTPLLSALAPPKEALRMLLQLNGFLHHGNHDSELLTDAGTFSVKPRINLQAIELQCRYLFLHMMSVPLKVHLPLHTTLTSFLLPFHLPSAVVVF